ncbi:MAG: GCN5-related N-acetyltransferase [Clostridia bacterium]|nr:GCN5-related N-acetyltransferase [Clostridia bacterium]
MEIRIMTIDDYDTVYQLWSGTNGMGMRSLDDSKAGIEKFINRNPTTNFVTVINDIIVGVTLSGHDGRRGYIYHTAVKNEFRRKGIGKALINAVYDSMKNEDINKVSLVVFKANETGNAFWKFQGWEQRMDLNYYNKSLNDNNF